MARIRIFFHRTTKKSANGILKCGFKDGKGNYRTTREFIGVWISDRPLDMDGGAWGGTLLKVQISLGRVEKYEWIEIGKPYREFLVPAKILNQYSRVSIVEEDIDGKKIDHMRNALSHGVMGD